MKVYYSVLSQDRIAGEWAIEFGSYDATEAIEEMRALRDSAQFHKVTVEFSADTQASIEAMVAKMNHRAMFIGPR